MDDYLHYIELVSLCLTPIVLALVLVVLVIYSPHLGRLLASKEPLSPQQKLMLGIALSFLGKLVDNAYWAIPWTGSYVDSRHAGYFFAHGVAVNIPARQVSTILASVCHIGAAWTLLGGSREGILRVFWACFAVSVVYMLMVCHFMRS
jgi:hypothetical protein